MFKRIYAVFRARNLEFLRDRGTLSWNIVLPFALMFGLSFIFSGDRPQYTVGILQPADANPQPFMETRYVEFVAVDDETAGLRKVARHQLDLLVSFTPPARYWVNPDSARGYFAELALLQAGTTGPLTKVSIQGEAVRYVDWVLPGILAMNMMFSCLFGVGYVVVRYRKNGFLKRLRATPLRAIEFAIAQVASRLVLIIAITVLVYAGTSWLLDTRMDGSYFALFAVALLGCVTLISLGLLIAARVTSEELAGGLLNLAAWPMMLLSGVWYSLESASEWVRQLANAFPLTHVLSAARAIMLDGATLGEVLPQLLVLALMSAAFLGIAAGIFRWRAT
ncbi:MAG TPA: ABC transporter permease [Woeseiaceae bacterium]|nr:ABC transporter permease [Woeseiaceae bacterium]